MAFLRVKIKSLAAEAAIIRREERLAKLRGDESNNQLLHLHRVLVVRRSARHALLAYGMMRGRRRVQLEATFPPKFSDSWVELHRGVADNLKRFDGPEAGSRDDGLLTRWFEGKSD